MPPERNERSSLRRAGPPLGDASSVVFRGRWRLAFLAAEVALVFVALPVIVAIYRPSVHILVALWGIAIACFAALVFDRAFDRRQLWNAEDLRARLRPVLRRFALAAVVLGLTVWFAMPEYFFDFPQRRPKFWALVMLLYPWLSVYPQGLVWRAFVFHRYKPLFGEGIPMIVASAALFSLSHLAFHNVVALGLTAVGGLLFATTYHRTRSLLVCQIEHALYGCLLFTIGLGRFVYYGG